MRTGLTLWTELVGMPTEECFYSGDVPPDTDLKLYITDVQTGYYGAQYGPHTPPYTGTGIYVRYSGDTWTNSLAPGGFGWITIIHELGHAMGFAHPHDQGGGSNIFPGVINAFQDKGQNDLNQNTFTVMSYIDTNSGINPTGASKLWILYGSYGF